MFSVMETRPDIMLAQDAQGFQGDLEVSGPAVQGVDDDDVELVLGGIIQKLAEDGTAGDGIDVGRFAFFPVDP